MLKITHVKSEPLSEEQKSWLANEAKLLQHAFKETEAKLAFVGAKSLAQFFTRTHKSKESLTSIPATQVHHLLAVSVCLQVILNLIHINLFTLLLTQHEADEANPQQDDIERDTSMCGLYDAPILAFPNITKIYA